MVLALAVLAWAGPRRAGAGVGMGTIEESEEVKHAKAKEQAETYYKDGMQALAEGNVERAVQRLLWVANMGRMRIDSPYPEQAFEQLKVLADRGAKDLAVARELVAGEDHAAGVKELRRITRVYLGLAPAKEAGRLLRELEKDPAFREAVLAQGLADDFEKARALEAEAEAILHPPAAGAPEPEPEAAEPPAPESEPRPAGSGDVEAGGPAQEPPKELTPEERQAKRIEKLVEAYALYDRIVRQGGETVPAKAAAEAMARLRKEAAVAERLAKVEAERRAREWMGLATNYFKAGRLDLARQYSEKVIASYPNSPEAGEARDLLEALK
jgi:outer membrane protein assembly factor BamD (BamD/ComL family)